MSEEMPIGKKARDLGIRGEKHKSIHEVTGKNKLHLNNN